MAAEGVSGRLLDGRWKGRYGEAQEWCGSPAHQQAFPPIAITAAFPDAGTAGASR
jgi:hypothetical protein